MLVRACGCGKLNPESKEEGGLCDIGASFWGLPLAVYLAGP